MDRVSLALSKLVVNQILPRVDRRLDASRRPFNDEHLLRPHIHSGRWTGTHYGIFLPELPAPHRYLNTMTLIGATGTELFDTDYPAAGGPRRTATLMSSTAAERHHHDRTYDSVDDCYFATDGSELCWANDLCIRAEYPYFTVHGRYRDFKVDLELTATGEVSYFGKSPLYTHFSLLTECTGAIDDATGFTPIRGLGAVEYARYLNPLQVNSGSTTRKLPADFFTYQIVNLDAGTQILLTDVQARGTALCRLMHVRTSGFGAQVYPDVRMDVLEYQDNPALDDRGHAMRIPHRFRWTAKDPAGAELLTLTGTVDTAFRSGHGRGYVCGYSYTGAYRGNPIAGSAYTEWVDLRR